MLVSGDDLMAVPMISFGAEGAISVLANAYPEKFSSMIQQALNGEFTAAAALLLSFVGINPLLYEEGNPVGVKVLLERFGICSASVRLPLVEASAGLRDKIDKLL